jgi:hypothetical protein
MKWLILFVICSHSLLADTNEQANRIDRIFNELRATNLQILDGFYDPSVLFIDPLGQHQGLESVKKYYQNLYQNVESIRFEKMGMVSNQNTHVFFWRMVLKTPSLNGGDETFLIGNSHIVFNEKDLVSYHRDYFDMGEFIYQHIPVLGFIIRKVNQRLKAE